MPTRRSLMRKYKIATVILLSFLCSTLHAQSQKGLKVFISVDMEGVAGVVSGRECSSRGRDYDYFRRLMTLETNAAIEGESLGGESDGEPGSGFAVIDQHRRRRCGGGGSLVQPQ